MSWTNAASPTTPTYENVAPFGSIAYDENTITYDQADITYDGIQAWSNANAPTSPTYTNKSAPTSP